MNPIPGNTGQAAGAFPASGQQGFAFPPQFGGQQTPMAGLGVQQPVSGGLGNMSRPNQATQLAPPQTIPATADGIQQVMQGKTAEDDESACFDYDPVEARYGLARPPEELLDRLERVKSAASPLVGVVLGRGRTTGVGATGGLVPTLGGLYKRSNLAPGPVSQPGVPPAPPPAPAPGQPPQPVGARPQAPGQRPPPGVGPQPGAPVQTPQPAQTTPIGMHPAVRRPPVVQSLMQSMHKSIQNETLGEKAKAHDFTTTGIGRGAGWSHPKLAGDLKTSLEKLALLPLPGGPSRVTVRPEEHRERAFAQSVGRPREMALEGADFGGASAGADLGTVTGGYLGARAAGMPSAIPGKGLYKSLLKSPGGFSRGKLIAKLLAGATGATMGRFGGASMGGSLGRSEADAALPPMASSGGFLGFTGGKSGADAVMAPLESFWAKQARVQTADEGEDSTAAGAGNTMRGWQWKSLQKDQQLGSSKWLPRVFKSSDTPLTELLASPAKQSLLGGMLGGGLGAVGGHFANRAGHTGQSNTQNTLLGAGLGALVGGVGAYAHRRKENDHVNDVLRQTPPGATVHDRELLKKSEQESTDGPIQRSAVGESKGLRFADAGPQTYGRNAWRGLSRWFKGGSKIKRQPDPFEGKHAEDLVDSAIDDLPAPIKPQPIIDKNQTGNNTSAAGGVKVAGIRDALRTAMSIFRTPSAVGREEGDKALMLGLPHGSRPGDLEDRGIITPLDRHMRIHHGLHAQNAGEDVQAAKQKFLGLGLGAGGAGGYLAGRSQAPQKEQTKVAASILEAIRKGVATGGKSVAGLFHSPTRVGIEAAEAARSSSPAAERLVSANREFGTANKGLDDAVQQALTAHPHQASRLAMLRQAATNRLQRTTDSETFKGGRVPLSGEAPTGNHRIAHAQSLIQPSINPRELEFASRVNPAVPGLQAKLHTAFGASGEAKQGLNLAADAARDSAASAQRGTQAMGVGALGGSVGAVQADRHFREKKAAPAWVKMIQRGLLSPQATQRIASSMPAGQFRTIGNLGHGAQNLADRVVGNLGEGVSGNMVRKLPLRQPSTSLTEHYQPLVNDSRAIEHQLPSTTVPYHKATDKGIFQQFDDPAVHGVVSNLQQGRNIKALNAIGVGDLHPGNMGQTGRAIDYSVKGGQGAAGVDWHSPMVTGQASTQLGDVIPKSYLNTVRSHFGGGKLSQTPHHFPEPASWGGPPASTVRTGVPAPPLATTPQYPSMATPAGGWPGATQAPGAPTAALPRPLGYQPAQPLPSALLHPQTGGMPATPSSPTAPGGLSPLKMSGDLKTGLEKQSLLKTALNPRALWQGAKGLFGGARPGVGPALGGAFLGGATSEHDFGSPEMLARTAAGAAAFSPRAGRLGGPGGINRGGGIAAPLVQGARGNLIGNMAGSTADYAAGQVGYDTHGAGSTAGAYLGGGLGGMRGGGQSLMNAGRGAVGQPMRQAGTQGVKQLNQFGMGTFDPILGGAQRSANWLRGRGFSLPKATGPGVGIGRRLGQAVGTVGLAGGIGGMGLNAINSYVGRKGQELTDNAVDQGLGAVDQYVGGKEQQYAQPWHNMAATADPVFRAMGFNPDAMHPAQKLAIMSGLGVGAGGAVTGHPGLSAMGMMLAGGGAFADPYGLRQRGGGVMPAWGYQGQVNAPEARNELDVQTRNARSQAAESGMEGPNWR